jgi:hypothetical protein
MRSYCYHGPSSCLMKEREWKGSHLDSNSNLGANRNDFSGPVSSREDYLVLSIFFMTRNLGNTSWMDRLAERLTCTGFRHKNIDVIT